MKDTFFGYYSPNADQYKRLWKEGLIVLDTNVLLNLYRLPTTARDELIRTLELLRDRLWIPHQVALEFQRRRLTVISSERKSTEEALAWASKLLAELKRKVDALQIDKRGLGIESQPLIDGLETANAKLIEAIKAVQKSQLDIASTDPVREKLDEILDGRVGPGPKMQAELDDLVQGGEDRFKERIPPGFADADKDKNPNEATFIHDHLKYHSKLGDLILWRQLIQHVKSTGIKTVLLVTADTKEDWWSREQGKTMGPHPELVREIFRDGGVELFWMYSSVQFIEHANKYAAATVSSVSVAELQQIVLSTPERLREPELLPRLRAVELQARSESEHYWLLEQSVQAWLSHTQGEVQYNRRGFPDFVTRQGDDVHGYELKILPRFDRMQLGPNIVDAISRGYVETKEGRLTKFTLIVVIPESDYFAILESDRTGELIGRLGRLLSRYPISAIIVGAVVGGNFEPLVSHRGPDLPGFSDDFPEED